MSDAPKSSALTRAARERRAILALVATIGVLLALFFISWLVSGPRRASKKTEPTAKAKRPPFNPGSVIKIAGESFDIGTPVVLWTDPIGYNAYLEKCWTSKEILPGTAENPPKPGSSPKRYGTRVVSGKGAWADRVRKRGWELAELKEQVHQFVVHYDVVGTSERCFRALHDQRGLSVHFMLDLDGTIYQTLDVRERAFHASDANDISVGVEIANLGARSGADRAVFDEWYRKVDVKGRSAVIIIPPDSAKTGPQRLEDYVPEPLRPVPVEGVVQGAKLTQWDFTAPQYAALARLIRGISKALPRVKIAVPRDAKNGVVNAVLPNPRRLGFEGIVGHYHISDEKYDPGPAFQWTRLLDDIRALDAK